jgi:dihydrofolate reductase
MPGENGTPGHRRKTVFYAGSLRFGNDFAGCVVQIENATRWSLTRPNAILTLHAHHNEEGSAASSTRSRPGRTMTIQRRHMMAKLSVFNFITLNGCFKGPRGEIQWHRHGKEEQEYAEEGANSESILLMGRKTYQMMATYWPTPMALRNAPDVARGMNASRKVVFSRKLKQASWENTRIVSSDPVRAIRRMKREEKEPLTILGSGSIVTLCTEHGLVDEFQFMVDPVLIGSGVAVAGKISHTIDLKLTSHRVFRSGIVLLCYAPA